MCLLVLDCTLLKFSTTEILKSNCNCVCLQVVMCNVEKNFSVISFVFHLQYDALL